MALAAKQWVFTLSAIAMIGEAQLSQAGNEKGLEAAQNWLERYNRQIVIAIATVFGILFLWKGISGLTG